MQTVARSAVVVLFLVSAASFVSYLGIHAGLSDPALLERLRRIAADVAMQRQASFVLYLGAATALLATVSLIILAVIDRHAGGPPSDDDDDTYGDDDHSARLDACPECHEPIKGIEAVCRECGHRFGPGSWSRRE